MLSLSYQIRIPPTGSSMLLGSLSLLLTYSILLKSLMPLAVTSPENTEYRVSLIPSSTPLISAKILNLLPLPEMMVATPVPISVFW